MFYCCLNSGRFLGYVHSPGIRADKIRAGVYLPWTWLWCGRHQNQLFKGNIKILCNYYFNDPPIWNSKNTSLWTSVIWWRFKRTCTSVFELSKIVHWQKTLIPLGVTFCSNANKMLIMWSFQDLNGYDYTVIQIAVAFVMIGLISMLTKPPDKEQVGYNFFIFIWTLTAFVCCHWVLW